MEGGLMGGGGGGRAVGAIGGGMDDIFGGRIGIAGIGAVPGRGD